MKNSFILFLLLLNLVSADSEIPLVDEGNGYRGPTKIFLKKGWNSVLLKCLVGRFSATDWQNPVKWMFTFVPFGD